MDTAFVVLLFIVAMAATGFVVYRLARIAPPAPPPPADTTLVSTLQNVQTQLGGLQEAVRNLPSADVVKGLRDRIGAVEGKLPADLSGSVRQLQESITKVEAEFRARKEVDERNQTAIRKIESVLAGSQSRGAAGEVVLAEAFAQFPPEMADTQFKVSGKPVEFALVLPSRKRLPIDSKWPAGKELEQFGETTDPVLREELMSKIEKAVLKKVDEVTKYIDPATTASLAIAAIPDAAYFACRTAHISAYRQRVLLMPYSLTVPFLLALYNLHLQFARSIDVDNLEVYLAQIETYLTQFDEKLDNSVERGATMVLNAYQDLRQRIGQMRGTLAYLRESRAEPVLLGEESLLKPTTDDSEK
ncbi:MAG TPA: DNA recombination protein RmuC [Candidatus Acidoferrales bacterium]